MNAALRAFVADGREKWRRFEPLCKTQGPVDCGRLSRSAGHDDAPDGPLLRIGSGAAHGNSPDRRPPSPSDAVCKARNWRGSSRARSRGFHLGRDMSCPPSLLRAARRPVLFDARFDRSTCLANPRRAAPILRVAFVVACCNKRLWRSAHFWTDGAGNGYRRWRGSRCMPFPPFRNAEVLRRRLPRRARKQAPHVRADVLAGPYGRRQPSLPGLTTHFFASLLSRDVCLLRALWPPAKRSLRGADGALPASRRRSARFTRLRPFLAAPEAGR